MIDRIPPWRKQLCYLSLQLLMLLDFCRGRMGLTKNFRPTAQNMNLFLLASIAIVVNNSVNSVAVGRNPPSKSLPKDGFHIRNKHRNRYDFPFLKSTNPSLVPFVSVNKYGDESIEFSNPLAVTALNKVSLTRRRSHTVFWQSSRLEISPKTVYCHHHFAVTLCWCSLR